MSKMNEAYGTVAKVLASILEESINPTAMNWDVFIKITDHFTNVADAMYEHGYTMGSDFSDEKYKKGKDEGYDEGYGEGYIVGHKHGKDEGYEKGYEVGHANYDHAYTLGWTNGENAAKRAAERLKNGLA